MSGVEGRAVGLLGGWEGAGREKGVVCMIRLMVVLLLRWAQEVSRYLGHVSLKCPRAAGSREHLGLTQSG